jgi:hypothetical protein
MAAVQRFISAAQPRFADRFANAFNSAGKKFLFSRAAQPIHSKLQ